jgi:GTPase SAR1 family protein
LAYKKYDDDYKPTESIITINKDINIDKASHKMKLIDTPGLDEEDNQAIELIRQANIVIFVYDVTGTICLNLDNKGDYEKCKAFISLNKKPGVNNQVWVMAGNKIDLPKEYRKVNSSEAEMFAKSHGCVWGEISCYQKDGVKRLFKDNILPAAKNIWEF